MSEEFRNVIWNLHNDPSNSHCVMDAREKDIEKITDKRITKTLFLNKWINSFDTIGQIDLYLSFGDLITTKDFKLKKMISMKSQTNSETYIENPMNNFKQSLRKY